MQKTVNMVVRMYCQEIQRVTTSVGAVSGLFFVQNISWNADLEYSFSGFCLNFQRLQCCFPGVTVTRSDMNVRPVPHTILFDAAPQYSIP